jgi:putative tryptophan/tyrosine transport system substrate-binding protein
MAADLVQRQMTVIAATTTPAALAAKAATATIPIVFEVGADPVNIGLVASLNRPGGNVTGVAIAISLLGAKRFEVLRDLIVQDKLIAFLVNPTNPNAVSETKDVQNAARALGRQVRVLYASSEREIDAAFTTLVQQKAGALILATDPFFTARQHQIVALANHYVVPTIYYAREYVVAGGLLSYGPNIAEAYRQVGDYAGRILKGTKPAELPVMQSTKFDLFINLRTARDYGFVIPPALLALADEVIE